MSRVLIERAAEDYRRRSALDRALRELRAQLFKDRIDAPNEGCASGSVKFGVARQASNALREDGCFARQTKERLFTEAQEDAAEQGVNQELFRDFLTRFKSVIPALRHFAKAEFFIHAADSSKRGGAA